jgi:peptidoglycan/LPS O-acetylase OafA/YrhL
VARGSDDTEPFIRLLGPGNLLGLYGVFTFFIISGFLLARSLHLRPDAITYSVNRTLRILPGFLFCVLVTVAVIGPLFTTLSLTEYVSSPQTREYVTKSIVTLNDAYLPGVYVASGREVHMVTNGSLWSLHYEALSYVFLLFLWTLVPSAAGAAAIAIALSIFTWVYPPFGEWIASIAYTLPYFSGGMLMYWLRGRNLVTESGALVCLVLFVVSCLIGVQLYTFALFGAYIIAYLGERPNFGSAIARRFGDCSYGIYLYGWPAEQMVRRMTGTTNPWLLFALALPLAALLAWISFHLVEKPSMNVRVRVADRIRSWVRRVRATMRSPRAGVLGAKAGFVISAALLLTSKVQWWYFTESMFLLLLGTAAGLVLGAPALKPRGSKP